MGKFDGIIFAGVCVIALLAVSLLVFSIINIGKSNEFDNFCNEIGDGMICKEIVFDGNNNSIEVEEGGKIYEMVF